MMQDRPLSSQQITSKALKEVLPNCGICGQTLSGHLFKYLAQAPVESGSAERTLIFLEAVKRGDWSTIQSFQEFNGLLDVIVVYALKCLDGRLSVTAYISRYELYDVDSFLLQQPVSDCNVLVTDGDWSAI